MIFRKIARALCWVIEGSGALVADVGVVLLYVLSLAWLKFGFWPPNDLQTFWSNMQLQWPNTEWAAVQKIIDSMPSAILRAPLWLTFLIIGAIIYIFGFVGAAVLDDFSSITKKAK